MSRNKKFNQPLYKNFEQLSKKYFDDTLFHDVSIEKSVLAIMLSEEMKQQMGSDYLTPNDFFSLEYKQLFELIQYKRKNSINHITFFGYYELADVLKEDKQLQVKFNLVNQSLLDELSMSFINETNFNFYLEKLIELSRLRAMEVFYSDSLNAFCNKKDVTWDDTLSDFETFIVENQVKGIQNSSFIPFNEATSNFLEKIEKIISGQGADESSVYSGFSAIDNYVKGFKPGQLIVLAARPGVGKTALALNIANNITKDRDKSCAFISLEMPVNELVARYYASVSNIELNKIQNPQYLTGDDYDRLRSISTIKSNDTNLYFDDVATSKITDIIWKIKQLSKDLNGGLNFVVIDYLQLITGGPGTSGNRQNEVSAISRSLKTLALDLKIPIMALSQLSRNVENREDKKPQLHDLRESGSIEQDADIVIFLSRVILDKKESNDPLARKYKLTDVSVAKNRNGQPGYSELIYEGERVTFRDVEQDN